MPLYEGIGIVAEKHSVILDIGAAYTKCGFARETGPRWIIPSVATNPHTEQTEKIWNYRNASELFGLLKEFLHMIYFRCLVVNPKDRRVVIVESVFCPTVFRETLAKVLFQHFEAPSILFVPSHLMALFTLGVSSALVIDVGYTETVALPIYEGVVILNACQSVPVGGQAIHRRIEASLMEQGTVQAPKNESQILGAVLMEPLKEEILEDIKVRTCFVTTYERGHKLQCNEALRQFSGQPGDKGDDKELIPPTSVDYPLDGEIVMSIPGTLREWAAELLFEQDGDQQSAATLVVDALLKCPIDTRRTLAENLVIMGGTAMLPGFAHRLLKEVKALLHQPKYEKLLPIQNIRLHQPPAKENYTAWLGAAIFGSTDAVSFRSITREHYLEQRCIPDWSDQHWNLQSSKTVA